MRFAYYIEYKERTIINIGATNYICNNLSKFIE
jgi:hypothetical protein